MNPNVSIFTRISNQFRAGLPVVSISSPSPSEEETVIKKLAIMAGALAEPLPVFVFDLAQGLKTVTLATDQAGEVSRVVFKDAGIQFDSPLHDVLDLILHGGQETTSQPSSEQEGETEQPFKRGIFILLDIEQFLSGDKFPEIARRIKNLGFALKRSHRRVVLLGGSAVLPDAFQGLVYCSDYKMPQADEIRQTVTSTINRMAARFKQVSAERGEDLVLVTVLDSAGEERLIRACLGLSIEEIGNALRLDIIERSRVDEQTIDLLNEFKVEKLRKLNVEFAPPADVRPGGYANFQKYIKSRTKLFDAAVSPQPTKLKLPTPRGVLLVGHPGTGKTLMAKAVSHTWGIPCLKVDLSSMYGGVVGETETNMRTMLEVAEAIAPCVLFLDEIEKALSGATGHNGDSGVSRRMIGTLLQWMNDKTKAVYVMATANNVRELQAQFPELLRKGRFDDIFYVGLPTLSERVEIFRNHLANQETQMSELDLNQLAADTQNFTGAEIAKVVGDAVILAFEGDRDEILMEDLVEAIAQNPPQAASNLPALAQLTDWARANNVRFASESEPTQAKKNKSLRTVEESDVAMLF